MNSDSSREKPLRRRRREHWRETARVCPASPCPAPPPPPTRRTRSASPPSGKSSQSRWTIYETLWQCDIRHDNYDIMRYEIQFIWLLKFDILPPRDYESGLALSSSTNVIELVPAILIWTLEFSSLNTLERITPDTTPWMVRNFVFTVSPYCRSIHPFSLMENFIQSHSL